MKAALPERWQAVYNQRILILVPMGEKSPKLNRESNVIDTMYDLGSLASTATHSPHP